MRKYIFQLLLLVILILAASMKTRAEEDKVRVGFPIQEGLTEVDEHGEYSGYTYDYLMEISQYTGWEYEFVRVDGSVNEQIEKLMDMLLNDEIDLMGAMRMNEKSAQALDYSGNNYGMAYSALFSLKENSELNSSNFSSVKRLKVAVIESSQVYVAKLEQFAEMTGFEVDELYCASEEEQINLVRQGEADAMLTVDISYIFPDDLLCLAKFAPEPFYFAATKGSKELINALNSAITNINNANPYYMTELHEKYFSAKSVALYLSNTEKEYIRSADKIKVAVLPTGAPVQYWDDEGLAKGVSIDVLDYISEQTGLSFEYIPVRSQQELGKLIGEGGIDMAAGALRNTKMYEYRECCSFSVPYLDVPMAVAMKAKNQGKLKENPSVAVAEEDGYPWEDGARVENTETVSEAMRLLESDKVDFCYGNSYIMQYNINAGRHHDIMMFGPPEEMSQKLCYTIYKTDNQMLLSIVNKAVQSLSDTQIQEYLYQNSFQISDITLLSYIRNNPKEAALWMTVLTLVLALFLLSFCLYNYRRMARRDRMENERYEQISELSNEFIYEYDIKKDVLKLPEKCAEFLQCGRVVKQISKLEPKNEFFSFICRKEQGSREIEYEREPGNKKWFRIISKVIYEKGQAPSFCVGKITDIQKEKQEQNELLERSRRDGLTGIYNAAACAELVNAELAGRQEDNTGSLFILDVDYFKKINDTYGHYQGDCVLRNVAETLSHVFRKQDIVGRIGGDEFLVYLKGSSAGDIAAPKCAQICRKVKEIPVGEDGLPGRITVSIGAAAAKKGDDYQSLYQRADAALYVVKGRGRNGCEIIK